MDPVIFYTRPGCHLCEDGLWILQGNLQDQALTIETVDISQNPALEAKYGPQIPVLRHAGMAADLAWPFTPESILAWLDQKT